MEAKRQTSTERPLPVEYLGDGSYYYNYDIREYVVPDVEGTHIEYSFVQVHLRGLANYADCVEAVIRAYVSESQEFDLVNSYNKFVLGLSTDVKYRDEYIAYLNLLEEIKTNIKKNF